MFEILLTMPSISGHLSSKELSVAKVLASENQIKREYMAHGVERINVEVTNDVTITNLYQASPLCPLFI